MRRIVIGFAFAALVSTPALAEAVKPASSTAVDVAAREAISTPRTLYICDASDLTRRSFERQHGAMQFVKADKAAAKGEAWNAPRCMTSSEYYRLRRTLAKNER